ncbi:MULTISPECIES: formylglycine-generating enzyme family protein [unclassified Bradyrhizobium]|uniref:formylglycine-generating enzyme family protein n=1 Tax=unclassified Bradyrhizobium TaxID=2631580 RepID=UPI0030D57B86
MSVCFRLLAPSAAVSLILVSSCSIALAKPSKARERATPAKVSNQTPPAPPPRQYFPDKPIQPLTPEIEAQLRPMDSFKECTSCPEMVVVPAGSFMMGTPANEPDRFKGEDPIHRVTFAKPFAVGRFAISFDDWDACLADGGCGGIKGDDKFGRGRLPAQGISFNAAKLYLAWLSKKVGRSYRLPSESEREYFTRAGTTTPFWFGNTITAQNANYQASTPYGGGPHGPDSKGPAVVDSYPPNPFGLYQVHGNVFEWTEDCFNKRYNEDTPTDGAPWLEGDCNRRMARGGRWDWSANMVRSGYREDGLVDGYGYSFRVVRTLNVP